MGHDRKEFKNGESAQGLNKLTLSNRMKAQARKLRKETGKEFKEIFPLPRKKEARKFETKAILERRAQNPDALPGTKGVH